MSDDIETRLRLARFELPQPDAETEAEAMRSALAELPEPAPPRRARRRTLRDLMPGALVRRRRRLAIVAAAVLPSIALGALVGALLWPATGAVASSAYPGPMFSPAAGWTTVTASPNDLEAGWAPLAWATNVALESNPGSHIFPLADSQLRDLPADGIVVVAWLEAPELVPAPEHPKDPPFVDRRLPLQLADAEVRPTWEAQPSPDMPEYLILARVKEQWVDVRVYFGRQHPSDDVLRAAQAELDRLDVPDPEVVQAYFAS
jgi:hypothetical protein